MEPRTCAHCGGPNTRHVNADYCSPECRSKAYSARKLEARHARLGDRACAQCGAPIELKKHPRVRFCSGACASAWAHAQHTAKRTEARTAARSGRTCLAPGCEAVIPPERTANAVYCSDECKRTVNLAERRSRAANYMRGYLYGITPDQWDARMIAQDYRCAICRSDEWAAPGPFNNGRPHAEHDPVTRRFRGITCGHCNLGMGHFKHDPALLRAAADYLEAATAA